MKNFLFLPLLSLLFSIQIAQAQFDRIAVQGSSTANGYGVPEDSSFSERLKKYYLSLGRIDTLYKIAASSLTCYEGMPNGYIPPSGRPNPNTSYNISRVLSRVPKPTIVIVSYPSNGYDFMSVAEILQCLRAIKDAAENQGVRCYVTTSQPRDAFSPSEREKLRVIKDSIMTKFGDSAIDFWTPIVDPASNTIRSELALGDGIHLNSLGHKILFDQVLAKKILDTTVAQPIVTLGSDITRNFVFPSISLNIPLSIQRLQRGTYTLTVKLQDSLGNDYKDTSLIIISSPSNIVPIANAGSDRTITLPSNSLILQGSGSDADGSIVSWLWTQIAGPNNSLIGTPGQPSTLVSGLIQGTYQFQITVSDNSGALATDIVQVIVNPALPPVNMLPIVNAGIDQTVQLPLNSVNLVGTATDNDGTIATYLWSRVSGPATFTLVSPNLPQTELRDLVAGTYLFRLQASDNAGGNSADTVIITVTSTNPPPVNILPVVNAGVDQSIQLPVNSVTLNGTASDSDGTIASYLWSRVSGPATFTLVSPGLAQTQLRDLIAGTYIFRLQATDNAGGNGSDTVIITVAAANPPPPVTGNQRVLIDLGMTATTTNSPDQWGKYWNNMTDARAGLRLNNAVTIENIATTIKIDVVRTTGSTASYDNNMRAGDGVLAIGGQYPASATNDHAFAHTSITNGQWRIYGLDPNRTYTIKFWGSRNSSGSRFIQIKRADETVWKEYNASLNTNYDSAAKFEFTGKTEMYFDIRVRAGSTFSYINVLDISSVSNIIAAPRSNAGSEIGPLLTEDIQVSPNPGSGRFSFRGSSEYNGQIRYFVRSNGGDLLIQGVVNKSGGEFTGTIDLTKYAAGPYFLTIVEGSNTRTVTLIKE